VSPVRHSPLLQVLLPLIVLVTVIAGGFLEVAAVQATFYVSPSGSDSNAGTLAAPFQTLAKAQSVVRTIDTTMTGDIYVYLRGGTYPISSAVAFAPQDSGTNGPYPGTETKTISVYVNGTRVQQISLPSTPDWESWSSLTTSLTLNAGANTITYQVDLGDTGWVNLDDLQVA